MLRSADRTYAEGQFVVVERRTDDPFGGADTARQLVERMPYAELELIPGAGHAPWSTTSTTASGPPAGS